MHNVGASQTPEESTLNALFEFTLVLSNYMATALAERGLTQARATVMWELFHGGPSTQRKISTALNVTPRNITALIDALEEAGFVERNPHPSDRRATLVALTKSGNRVAEALHEDQRKFAARLFGDIRPSDSRAFDRTLRTILDRVRAEVPAMPAITERNASG